MKTIRIGSIVFYRLSQIDVDSLGVNQPADSKNKEFELFPMIIAFIDKRSNPGEFFPRICGHVFLDKGKSLWVEKVRHGIVDEFGGFPPYDRTKEASLEAGVWYSLIPKF